jgi:RimJ/RimL family protein N-acetyltransferase
VQPSLTGPRVLLRPWRPDDADAVLAACQDPEIQRWTQVPVPYTRADAEGFVGEIAARTAAEGGALFAVVDRASGELAASIGLFPPIDGWAAIGYWTAAASRRRGLTAEALDVLARWAFDDRGLHRVELHVDPANAGSRAVAARAGFREEGLVRQRFRQRGVPMDVVLLSRLPGDPLPDR